MNEDLSRSIKLIKEFIKISCHIGLDRDDSPYGEILNEARDFLLDLKSKNKEQ